MFASLWSELRYRLRALVRRDLVERELDDELRFHLERQAEQLMHGGVPRHDAVRRARLAFGGVNRIKDDTRDARGTTLLEHFAQDLRYTLRGLRARPAFTAIVVVTIGLGVGVNAAMFGVMDRLLLRPPAYMIDAPLVHRVYLSWMLHGETTTERGIEYATYADLQRWSTAFSATAAFANRDEAVGTGEDVRDVAIATVSASYFDFFNAKPVIGRFFTAQEDRAPEGTAVAVLAYDYWRTRYAGRDDVLGATVRVGPETYRIIGVAPPHFQGVTDRRTPVLFLPITKFGFSKDPKYADNYGWSWLEMLVRRRAGVSVEAATADLTAAYHRSWNFVRAGSPSTPSVAEARVHAIISPVQLGRGPQSGPESKVIVWVSGVAFIVLLVACANVANLLLVRALRRRRELALRNALGASRGRIVAQLLTETLVLATLGGVAGVVAAQWGGGALRRAFLDASTPSDVFGDTRTLMFSGAITLATAVLAGLLPALRSNHEDLAGSLKAGTRDGAYRRSRTRNVLLVSQAALSVILLIGAGLFVRSLQQIRAVRLGYDVDPIVLLMARFRGPEPAGTRLETLSARLISEARSIPGVVNAAPLVSIPFLGSESRGLYVPGVDSVRRLGRFTLQAASPDYFATVGTRIVRGRGIEETDRANAPHIVVVSEAMAKALWPARDALGQCIRIGSDTMPCTTVVGVAENVRMRSLTGVPEFHYYLPIAQYSVSYIALSVRVSGQAAEYAEGIRRRLQQVMPGDSYLVARPMHDLTSPTMRPWEFGAAMFVAFGGLALALAAIGLYSVIAFGVTQRTHELGVRIALGAQVGDVLRLVVGEGVGLTSIGVVIGAAIALVAGRWTSPLLFHVSPKDPVVYVLVTLTLSAVGVVASAIPAARATRVDPTTALRAE